MKKEMRIAEIVPVDCLEKTKGNQYHMCLAHLVERDEKYAGFYKRMVEEGKFVMMDNGAAEDSQLDLEALVRCYDIINPTEIVLPDVLCDSKKTFERTRWAYFEMKATGHLKDRRIMVVPQGKSLEEWECSAYDLLHALPVDTIGVSKFLEMITQDPEIRYKACVCLKRMSEEFERPFEVHLLGCSEGPDVVNKCARDFKGLVRGCDSAFAYICTQAGVMIDTETTRPEGEIDFLHGSDYENLEENMSNFERACLVEDNGVTETWKMEV